MPDNPSQERSGVGRNDGPVHGRCRQRLPTADTGHTPGNDWDVFHPILYTIFTPLLGLLTDKFVGITKFLNLGFVK
ncbi:hypothetical protein ElyMa_004051200 [Elysia marginata]|uniref:Uncharacterized protein n=1 Tax=Elysia marginata TaxID=1093978 RepID=A0AAV4G682_9GAST|nr:hypothetical protein ElyMa_004051200 [Elysia marginata]